MNTINNFYSNTPYFFLSNFYPQSVRYENITYITSEHAYQAAKSLDHDVRMLIHRCSTPGAAKRMGGAILCRSDWNSIKVDVMRTILMEKFKPGSEITSRLLETRDAILVEGNWWHDTFWGQCNCVKHHGVGENNLGKLLMEIRNELKSSTGQEAESS